MPKKCTEVPPIHKLSEFFRPAPHGLQQNGGGTQAFSLTPGPLAAATPLEGVTVPGPLAQAGEQLQMRPARTADSSPSTQSTQSPAKSWPRREDRQPLHRMLSMEVSSNAIPTHNVWAYTPPPDHFAAITTMGQPVLDTTLKDMLSMLHSSMQANILASISY